MPVFIKEHFFTEQKNFCNISLGCFIYFVLLMLIVNVLVKVHLKSVFFDVKSVSIMLHPYHLV